MSERFTPPPGAHPHSLAFYQILVEAAQIHDKKQRDYGRTGDPFANVRASEDFGIPGWVGCMIRANDKMRRLQKAAAGGQLANETVEDSLIDLVVYTAIALALWREHCTNNGCPIRGPHDCDRTAHVDRP